MPWNWCENCHYTVLKKIKGSVTEASPADSGNWRLTKQESSGRFLGSICIGEIFQLEAWNSGSFVFIFLFTMKSMKKFETNFINWYFQQHLILFSELFGVYTRSKNEVWNRKNVTLEPLIKKSSNSENSTERNSPKNDSFDRYFSGFSLYTRVQEWDFKWRKRDVNFWKHTILWILRGGVQRNMTYSIGTYLLLGRTCGVFFK